MCASDDVRSRASERAHLIAKKEGGAEAGEGHIYFL